MDNLKTFITLFGAGLGLMIAAMTAIFMFAFNEIAFTAIVITEILSNAVSGITKKVTEAFDRLK